MNKRIALSIFGPALLVTLLESAGSAQVQRTFVSGLGSDSNPCSRAAPCRTFAQAISQANAGGEVYVLDTAGYGQVTITKSIAIVAPQGVTAGISVFTGDGIDINAGASDVIVLRGLTVNNQGSTGSGIVFNTGGTLHVESCVVSGFSSLQGVGLGFLGQTGTKLEVKDSIARNNRVGVSVSAAPGTTSPATIDHVRLDGNQTGLGAFEGSIVTVESSIASGNGVGFLAKSGSSGSVQLNLERCVASSGGTGIIAQAASTGPAEIDVEGCVASGNSDGISAIGLATVRVSNSTVTHNNQVGLLNNGSPAVLLSRGNNTVEGNTANSSGTIGTYTAK